MARVLRHLHQPEPVHRLREVLAFRHRDDSEARWHCCPHWQRTLGKKWNSREFAQRHGCRVPALYWSGRRLTSLPWEALPRQYVIRNTFSGGRRGTYALVDGRDLLHDVQYTPESLKLELRRTRRRRWMWPILVEEFIPRESSTCALPIEYKFYMFGETVGAIEVVSRHDGPITQVFYAENWTHMPERMMTKYAEGEEVDPPACLPELLACARRLSTAYGAPVRVDLYASDAGCVFSEFSNRPHGGHAFTPYAQRYFGDLWAQAFPVDVNP
jgi:hypothetical protein